MKLNLKRTALFMLMILCATMCITEWAIVLFKGSFTWFGLFTNLLELFIACELGEYFIKYAKNTRGFSHERFKKKKGKKYDIL